MGFLGEVQLHHIHRTEERTDPVRNQSRRSCLGVRGRKGHQSRNRWFHSNPKKPSNESHQDPPQSSLLGWLFDQSQSSGWRNRITIHYRLLQANFNSKGVSHVARYHIQLIGTYCDRRLLCGASRLDPCPRFQDQQ